MTLNGVMGIILLYITAFSSFGANYVKVVEAIVFNENIAQRIHFLATYDIWQYS